MDAATSPTKTKTDTDGQSRTGTDRHMQTQMDTERPTDRENTNRRRKPVKRAGRQADTRRQVPTDADRHGRAQTNRQGQRF